MAVHALLRHTLSPMLDQASPLVYLAAMAVTFAPLIVAELMLLRRI